MIQLAAALAARHGAAAAAEVFAAAGLLPLLDAPPAAMVDERAVASLYRALFARLPPAAAAAVAADSGRRTADYILAHRIPRPAQALLRALPPSWAGPLLLRAIARNAWTFAGSGRVSPGRAGPRSWRLEIAANPLAMPRCPWHSAVFERLFRTLVAPAAQVRHPRCCHDGAPACRFEITV